MRRRRRVVASIARGVVRSLLVWAILAALAWLDSTGPHYGRQAAAFSFILNAFNILSSALGTVAGFVAAQLEVVVGYLGTALAWLTRRVANILFSTGAIFSKVWDGVRLLWNNILKPVIQWVDTALRRVETWLRRTFEPLFKFLRAVRTQLDAVYKRFVQPVLDIIDFVKRINTVLDTLHIHVLDKLTEVLTRIEQRIEEPILWLYGKINELTDWLNTIVTADGLFQRVTLLRSMERDLAYSWRMLINARTGTLTDSDRIALREKTRLPSLAVRTTQLREVLRTGDFRADPDVAALSDELKAWDPPP